ncbi:MAG TPA: acyl-CoA dehydrogenase [Desulfotomaculum sp.]|nr:MAG: acyl-CoA dehydrogenase [Peptococcaceae bacterium BRH_c8a]KJS70412.1 MAG: acyl-CoA dehydrogenase [Desulfotomaculum sp. BICA1-6]HBX22073.1 acyl-CoA dehydrogenase [Desulfotomaculum sp.]
MTYQLNNEQIMIRDMVRTFVLKEIVPVARNYDEQEQFPLELLNKMNELGLLNMVVPEEYGGTGADELTHTIAVEEISRGCCGVATSAGANALASYAILLAGTDNQKRRFLTHLGEDGKLASFALTEPEAGSDVLNIKTIAVKKGQDYVITGAKCFITNASYAHQYTVFAVTNKSKGSRKLSCFVVPRDSEGVSVGRTEHKMGIRASNTADVIFENVRIPADNLIGDEGDGFKLAMQTLDHSRPTVAAQAVGLAQAALDAAVKFARERVQFGRPISEFQGIQFMLADMAIKVETARLLVYQVARMIDGRQPFTKHSAMAKTYASDAAMQVCTDAVQICGGYGYTREFPVEKFMRDAKILQIFEGTNQIQRIVIARQLLA